MENSIEVVVSVERVYPNHGRPKEYLEQYEEIVRLLGLGLSVREIELKTGISKSSVGRIRKEIQDENKRKDAGAYYQGV